MLCSSKGRELLKELLKGYNRDNTNAIDSFTWEASGTSSSPAISRQVTRTEDTLMSRAH